MIDYMRQNKETAGKTRIMAQEIEDVHGLHKFYCSSRCKNAALRVIHVQNAAWATQYLLRKYNVDTGDDLTGMPFGKWAKYAGPEMHAGKPQLKGKAFRTQRDPWRGIRRTALGLDYLKARDIRCNENQSSHEANSDVGRNTQRPTRLDELKMMELNCFDEYDGVCYGYDVNPQRLGVYVQYNDGEATPPDNVENPYSSEHRQQRDMDEKKQPNGVHRPRLPPMSTLDNGNTIIVFESTLTGSVTDTLIGARQQIESRWRRLSFYLPPKDLYDDSRLALECMDLVLEDVFKALSVSWEHFLGIVATHVSILEDKIYDSPADESRAPELWYNSSAWLKVERLVYIHLECVKELIGHLGELPVLDETSRAWLEGVVEQYQKLTTLVQEDLVKPTTNLSDLMYKSVGIRDSRQSLGLATSMWRLSWITFIFLPLTFIVGFFGMNVDAFAGDPSIKWYFIAAVPLMLLVLILWYMLKHALAARHQTPYQRGVYESMFHDLAVAHPDLWSRTGPRRHIQPISFFDRLRWRLLQRWFDPKRTVNKPPADPDEDVGGSGLGSYARFKRMLARRWLGTIRARRRNSLGDSEAGLGLMDASALESLVAASTPVMAAESPEIRSVTRANLERLSPSRPGGMGARGRSNSPRSSGGLHGQRPSSSGGSSGVMVDERDIRESLEAIAGLESPVYRGVRRSIDGIVERFAWEGGDAL